jgi:polysaccharide export outer membrane protein
MRQGQNDRQSARRWCRAAVYTTLCLGAWSAHAAEPARSVTAPSGEYRVNAGDELDVSVWGEERMQKTVRVLPDGTFAFPLAGRVSASGNTPREIADTITGRIKSNFRDSVPEVTVIVRDPAGMRFFVVGKVRTPGSYPISRSVNALQALSMAGGAADFADVSHAVLLRQGTRGQVVEPVDLGQMLKGGRALSPGVQTTELPMLGAGDVLVIP